MKTYMLLILIFVFVLTGCATQEVSYQLDVAPLLQDSCLNCHSAPEGSGYKATGLKFDSYDALMQGTVYGPVVIEGDSRRSILNMLVEGRAGKLQRMPHLQGDNSLTEQQIKLLSDWVNQGALNN